MSCAIAPKKENPVQADPSVKESLAKIQIDVAAGAAYKRSLRRLKKIVKSYPNTDAVDDAFMVMGQIYFKRQDYQSSYQSYMSVVNSDVFSPREAEALLGAAKALAKIGSYDEVLSLTNRCLKMQELSDAFKLKVYRLRFQVLGEVGDHIETLRALIYLVEKEPRKKDQDTYKRKAINFVEFQLSRLDLEIVTADRSFGFVRSFAFLRMGVLLFEQRDFWKAKDYLQETVKLAPETELAERANHLLKQIEARRKVEPRTVGAVLPLSGKAANFGYKTLRGIQIALGIHGPYPSKIKLAVVDSGGNSDSARRAVERLVIEDHVIAIIGSLSSKTAVAVASKADELGVPSIALSQKADITGVGPTVFRNALTSEMQVRQLVRVAMKNLEAKRFAILYPNDKYGVEYANLFWDEVRARGGIITGAQSYAPKETDFSGPIQRLVGTYYLKGRVGEYKYLLKSWQKKAKTMRGRTSPPGELLPPIIDFEVLFVPDDTSAIGQIAPMLAYQEVKGIRLLGTNIWNTSNLMKRGERFVEGAIFVDSLLSSDSLFQRSRFFQDFQNTFKEAPGLFEVQGFDAALIVRKLIEDGERTRVDLADSLASLKTFKGSLGTLFVNNRREVERPLVPLTVEKGRITRWQSDKKASE